MNRSSWMPLAILGGLVAAGGLLSLGVGPRPIGIDRLATVLWDLDRSSIEGVIVWELRLPRIVLAALVGSSLGVAGAGYQGLFRNPLADSYVIGASSGAALGATVAIILGLTRGPWGLSGLPLAALLGAVGAVSLVYGIAAVGRRVQTLSLLLAGVAVSSFIMALVSLLMFLHQEDLVVIMHWMMGNLAGKSWAEILASVPLMLLGFGLLWGLARGLDALTFGEETAATLGIRLNKLRALVVVAASLSTAAAVSTGGVIGFVGLIAPHVARMLVGARHVLIIPASGLVGALLLIVADDLARTVAAPAELPVGVITALLGTPFFVYLLKTRQRSLGAGP